MDCSVGPDICIYRGTSLEFNISITENGSPVDITGWTNIFGIKINKEDPTPAFTKNLVITDGTGGLATLILTPADTANFETLTYYYNFQFTNSDVSVRQIFEGNFKVEAGLLV